MKKNTLKKILGLVCVTAIFAACAEYQDGSVGLYHLVCLTVAGLSGWGLKRMEDAK